MSAVYAETSAVVRWLLGHSQGARVGAALVAATPVVTSSLTLVEVSRTLRRCVQDGSLSATQEALVRATFQSSHRHWDVRLCDDDVMQRASGAFPVEPVRTLDAIHLATALLYLSEVGPLDVISTDARVRDNAAALGFTVLP